MPSNNLLLTLFLLSQKARNANIEEMRYLIVNATRDAVPYTHGVLLESHNEVDPLKISAISEAQEVDPSNPYVVFLNNLYKYISNKKNSDTLFNTDHIDDQDLKNDCDKWLPKHILKINLLPPKQLKSNWRGVLIIANDKKFTKNNTEIMGQCSEIFAHSFGAFYTVSFWQDTIRKIKKSLRNYKRFYVAAALMLLFPLPSTVIAPAEVVADKPSLVRSSLDGIIQTVYVEPGEKVKKGQKLISYDTQSFKTKLSLARENERVAQTQLHQLMQEVLNNNNVRFQIAAAQGKLEEAKTNKQYVLSQMDRSTLYAREGGIVIFENAHDLLGRAVKIGEKIMLLAKPDQSALEVRLPVYQAISMPDDAKITFFTNISPHLPEKATLKYHSYRAHETPDGQMAYRIKGKWEGKTPDLRLGLKGNAKIYGYYYPIIWKILRQPIYHVRKWLGW